jgi:hypothetical protein
MYWYVLVSMYVHTYVPKINIHINWRVYKESRETMTLQVRMVNIRMKIMA